MHLLKYFLIFNVVAILSTACKKESTKSTPDEEECVTGRASTAGRIAEDRFIVVYQKDIIQSRGMNATMLRETSETVLERNNINTVALHESFAGEPGGFIANLSAAQAQALRNDLAIYAVEPDRIISLATCFTVAAPHLVGWGTKRVGYGDGTGKTAWIIDTGIDFEHSDLNVDANRSRSFLEGTPSADDENGHGTHVAGIIGAKNNSFGTLGVASGANLVSLRVLDKNGSGLLSYIVQALAYINVNASPGDVVNMSLGDDEGTSLILDQQVQNTAARGIYISIAAGNDHDLANKHSPGRANGTNIFTISAIDSLDNFANFSNYGNDVVDYAMPGVRVLSAFHENRYAIMSGTSMAAPHMSGILLLRGRSFTTSGAAKNDPDGNADPIAHY